MLGFLNASRRLVYLAVCAHQSFQVGADTLDHIVPDPGPCLAVEGDRGIPGAIAAIEHPAPTSIKPVKDPHRLAHRRSQVRGRGVHRDHQVKVGDQRRRIGKIIQLIGEVDHPGAVPAGRKLAFEFSHGRFAFLQTVEVGGDGGQRFEFVERQISPGVYRPDFRLFGAKAARPDQSKPQALATGS